MDERLLGKCGFYCGSCPTYIQGNCAGCVKEHEPGDCYTREIAACGLCENFPCDIILERPRCTVLDKDWLRWKKQNK